MASVRNLRQEHEPRRVDGEISERNSGAKWSAAMIIGYARVSTDGQTLDAQCAALTAAGAAQVFAEKVSCAVTDRKALALQ